MAFVISNGEVVTTGTNGLQLPVEAVTDAELAAIGHKIYPYGYGGGQRRGIQVSRRVAMTYGEIYRTQPAVRTVVDFLARGVASLDAATYKRKGTDRVRQDWAKSPLAAMLEFQANPTTTGQRLIHGIIADRAVYDRAYLLKIRATPKDPPGWLRRISPHRIEPVGGDWFEVEAYRIFGTVGWLDVPASEIVKFDGYDPEDPRKGVSPIESLRSILAEEYAATQYRADLWESGAQTAGQISRPADAPEWSDPERERFQSDWAAYQLSGAKSGTTPVLEDGMTWTASGVTPKDAQYVESRKLTREEVASEYHIAPPLIGILDHATFSNIEEQHVQLYVDTLGWWTSSTSSELNLQLVPDFYSPKLYFVEFDINAKLKGDFEQQATMLQTAIGGPYMTPNEGRNRINLPSIDGGDELIRPLNVTTGAQASPTDTAPAPGDVNPANPNDPAPPAGDPGATGPAADPAPPKSARPAFKARAADHQVTAHIDALTAFFTRQQKSVTSKYEQGVKSRGAKAEVHDLFDLNRWSAELAADLLKLALPLSAATGYATAKGLTGSADDYDPSETLNYLAAQTSGVATSINVVTQNQVGQALTAHDVAAALASVFAVAIAQRSISAGRAQATAVASWSTVEAGRQTGVPARKQWNTGENPRPSHAVMDGETVPLGEKFSNGGRWPGDEINLGPDEIDGCNCDVTIIPEGVEQ